MDSGCATAVPLSTGLNTLSCASTDGLYEFHLVRGSGAWLSTGLALPATIYAGQTVSGLTLGQGGVASLAELRVTMLASTGGAIAPASWLFDGTAATSSALFALTAPAAGSEPTPLFASFLSTGSDAWRFPAGPILRTTVLPQASLRLDGLAGSY